MPESDPYIQNLRARIDTAISQLFGGRKPEGLYEPMGYLPLAGGKRIRPLLLILACEAVGGCVEDCFHAAVAVELLHTFTLVHDDIMDHDDTRRGMPTVHIKWDQAMAILAGDGLVTMAYQSILKVKHPRLHQAMQLFTDGLLDICEGQAMDKSFEKRDDVTLNEYLLMIRKKTAILIRVCCAVGGILGNGKDTHIHSLGRFATALGLAFQIQDDLLDVISDASVLGKPMGSDLMEKKKTFLTIHFFENASGAVREGFNGLWRKPVLSDNDISQLIKYLQDTGSVESARAAVDLHFKNALAALSGLPPGLSRERLKKFALTIQKRMS